MKIEVIRKLQRDLGVMRGLLRLEMIKCNILQLELLGKFRTQVRIEITDQEGII